MTRFYNTIPEEQETIINIDYYTSNVNVYTSQKTVYSRLIKKLGEPTKLHYTQKQISGANWNIPFEDKKRINLVLSRPLLIGQRK